MSRLLPLTLDPPRAGGTQQTLHKSYKRIKETMKEFRDYDELFPELVYDIVNYFRVNNTVKPPAKKTVLDYCLNSRFNDAEPNHLIQPDTVYSICENLYKAGVLGCPITGMKPAAGNMNYIFMAGDDNAFLSKPTALVFRLNCLAYGFRYIYSAYKEMVQPVVLKKGDNETMGTCFRFREGIVTARHCLEADQVCIPSVPIDKLRHASVLVSSRGNIDIAYINLKEYVPLMAEKAEVLDEVLVMGYPKIPMFFDFCTAERASVSSIVPTRGAVASLADQYISRNAGPLMLVTARIRGGNSGGPVINAEGAVVGVSFAEPLSKGEYDEMGYGVAYPIDVLNQILQNHVTLKVNFVDKVK